MNQHEAQLVAEYTSGGNEALLLAKLEREHRKMLREMKLAAIDKGEQTGNLHRHEQTQG